LVCFSNRLVIILLCFGMCLEITLAQTTTKHFKKIT